MTQEELERKIAIRLAQAFEDASLGFPMTINTVGPTWLAVAREAMAMMERVAMHERELSQEWRRTDMIEARAIDLAPALDDEAGREG